MYSLSFWKKALERAVKSFVQGAIVVGGFISPEGMWSADAWQGALGLAVASVLTSIGSGFVGDKSDPSLV